MTIYVVTVCDKEKEVLRVPLTEFELACDLADYYMDAFGVLVTIRQVEYPEMRESAGISELVDFTIKKG